ncbi:hypothetical protein PGT21_027545 [Puccinia graminis f. sp. tritici]|uniref:Uncharacterized protein n=1 Tax=Puccinia graminis f. sp. tritici TaxID=56615 RepID=A0A5B0MGC0_PUCGR|nr:hypothetical protein PGT21_027545 [Puccinia graminis f. sp. tritici]
MADSETTDSIQSTVCNALRGLSDFCSQGLITNNQTLSPGQEAPSIDQIDVRQALMIEMQTSLLPSLRQHLADLLESQDALCFREEPHPNLQATLEILSQLEHTVKQIKSSFLSIRAAAQVSENEDERYGILKRHKSDSIMDKIHYTIRYPLIMLLNGHVALLEEWQNAERALKIRMQKRVARDTAGVFSLLKGITHLFHKSELSILQATWQVSSDSLELYIDFLSERVDPKFTQSNEEPSYYRIGDDRSDASDQNHPDHRAQINPSGDARHQQQPENILTNASSAVGRQHERSVNVHSSANSIGDHQPGQALTILPNEAPDEVIRIEPHLVKLCQSVMPFIKLGRLLLNRLLLAPSSRAPFTIDDRMSSAQFESFRDQTDEFFADLWNLLRNLLDLCNRDGRATIDEISDELDKSLISFDQCMQVLRPRLVPYSPSNQLLPLTTPQPEREKILNDWFSLLISQVHLAGQNFRVEIEIFRKNYADYIY